RPAARPPDGPAPAALGVPTGATIGGGDDDEARGVYVPAELDVRGSPPDGTPGVGAGGKVSGVPGDEEAAGTAAPELGVPLGLSAGVSTERTRLVGDSSASGADDADSLARSVSRGVSPSAGDSSRTAVSGASVEAPAASDFACVSVIDQSCSSGCPCSVTPGPCPRARPRSGQSR